MRSVIAPPAASRRPDALIVGAGPAPSAHATEPPSHHGAKAIGSDDQARSQLSGGAVSQADPHSQGSAILGCEKIEGARRGQEVDACP